MIKRNSHAFDELELMAYLDGELSQDRATAAANHLEDCTECKRLANELSTVSREMASWQIEPSQVEITAAMSAELETRIHSRKDFSASRRSLWHALWGTHRRALVGGLAVVVLASLLIFVSTPVLQKNEKLAEKALRYAPARTAPQTRAQLKDERSFSMDGQPAADAAQPKEAPNQSSTLDSLAKTSPAALPPAPPAAGKEPVEGLTGKLSELVVPSGPMVVRTAELELTTADFDRSRNRTEEILKKHYGYLGDLNVSGGPNAARMLTATLRVPAEQLDATITELKSLGKVEAESQKGEEVSEQYVDLQARIVNARNSEQRLTELLHRAGHLAEVLEVEEQIENVRENIERMEAERKNLAKQVAFSTLNVKISEDYKEHARVVPDSTSRRIRNAAVEGYETMVAGLLNLFLFLVSWGPSLLLWGAALFFPVRWLWRRRRHNIL